LLLGLSSLFGVKSIPFADQYWNVKQAWQKTSEGYLVFSAESTTLPEQCRSHPDFYLEFPPTIHSSTQVMIDDIILASTSTPNFRHAKGFYGSIVLPCFQVAQTDAQKKLNWQVTS